MKPVKHEKVRKVGEIRCDLINDAILWTPHNAPQHLSETELEDSLNSALKKEINKPFHKILHADFIGCAPDEKWNRVSDSIEYGHIGSVDVPKKGFIVGLSIYFGLYVLLVVNKYTAFFPFSQGYADIFDSSVNVLTLFNLLLGVIVPLSWKKFLSTKFKIDEIKIKEKFKVHLRNILKKKDLLALVCKVQVNPDRKIIEYYLGLFTSIDKDEPQKTIVLWFVGPDIPTEVIQDCDPLSEEARSDVYSHEYIQRFEYTLDGRFVALEDKGVYGGRRKILNKLIDFLLHDDLSLDELNPGHKDGLVLCGQAGYGKSTLLYQAIKEIQVKQKERILLYIFPDLNKRPGMVDIAVSLLLQMYFITGRKDIGNMLTPEQRKGTQPVESLKSLLVSPAIGKKVALIIDGWDEYTPDTRIQLGDILKNVQGKTNKVNVLIGCRGREDVKIENISEWCAVLELRPPEPEELAAYVEKSQLNVIQGGENVPPNPEHFISDQNRKINFLDIAWIVGNVRMQKREALEDTDFVSLRLGADTKFHAFLQRLDDGYTTDASEKLSFLIVLAIFSGEIPMEVMAALFLDENMDLKEGLRRSQTFLDGEACGFIEKSEEGYLKLACQSFVDALIQRKMAKNLNSLLLFLDRFLILAGNKNARPDPRKRYEKCLAWFFQLGLQELIVISYKRKPNEDTSAIEEIKDSGGLQEGDNSWCFIEEEEKEREMVAKRTAEIFLSFDGHPDFVLFETEKGAEALTRLMNQTAESKSEINQQLIHRAIGAVIFEAVNFLRKQDRKLRDLPWSDTIAYRIYWLLYIIPHAHSFAIRIESAGYSFNRGENQILPFGPGGKSVLLEPFEKIEDAPETLMVFLICRFVVKIQKSMSDAANCLLKIDEFEKRILKIPVSEAISRTDLPLKVRYPLLNIAIRKLTHIYFSGSFKERLEEYKTITAIAERLISELKENIEERGISSNAWVRGLMNDLSMNISRMGEEVDAQKICEQDEKVRVQVIEKGMAPKFIRRISCSNLGVRKMNTCRNIHDFQDAVRLVLESVHLEVDYGTPLGERITILLRSFSFLQASSRSLSVFDRLLERIYVNDNGADFNKLFTGTQNALSFLSINMRIGIMQKGPLFFSSLEENGAWEAFHNKILESFSKEEKELKPSPEFLSLVSNEVFFSEFGLWRQSQVNSSAVMRIFDALTKEAQACRTPKEFRDLFLGIVELDKICQVLMAMALTAKWRETERIRVFEMCCAYLSEYQIFGELICVYNTLSMFEKNILNSEKNYKFWKNKYDELMARIFPEQYEKVEKVIFGAFDILIKKMDDVSNPDQTKGWNEKRH